jgi:hypothetical protein
MRKAFVLLLACACLAQQTPPAKKSVQKTEPKKDNSQAVLSFALWLAKVSGLTATSSGLKGFEIDHKGDIWSRPIEGGARQRITFNGGYSWPVFSSDDKTIIALRGGDLWSIPLNGGEPVKLPHTLPGVTILLGTGSEGIVLMTAKQIGTYSPYTGAFSAFPATEADFYTINQLREPFRSYDNGKLTVSEQDLSEQGMNGWQPSLSQDRKTIVYIR